MFLSIWDYYLTLARKLLIRLSTRRIVQITISSQVRLVFITLLLTMTACSIESSTSISNNLTFTPLPDLIFFPKQELVNGEWIRMTGGIIGDLVEVDGCLRLNSSYDDTSYLIVWPSDYTLDVSNNVVQLRDSTGQIMVRVGEEVHMGGGEVTSLEGVVSVNKQLLQEMPSECSGPYWISGGIISSPVDKSEKNNSN